MVGRANIFSNKGALFLHPYFIFSTYKLNTAPYGIVRKEPPYGVIVCTG